MSRLQSGNSIAHLIGDLRHWLGPSFGRSSTDGQVYVSLSPDKEEERKKKPLLMPLDHLQIITSTPTFPPSPASSISAAPLPHTSASSPAPNTPTHKKPASPTIHDPVNRHHRDRICPRRAVGPGLAFSELSLWRRAAPIDGRCLQDARDAAACRVLCRGFGLWVEVVEFVAGGFGVVRLWWEAKMIGGKS